MSSELNDEILVIFTALSSTVDFKGRTTVFDIEAYLYEAMEHFMLLSKEAETPQEKAKYEKNAASIRAFKPASMTDESFRQIWEARGFEIKDYGEMYARKSVQLSLASNKEQLSSEIKQCLEVTK